MNKSEKILVVFIICCVVSISIIIYDDLSSDDISSSNNKEFIFENTSSFSIYNVYASKDCSVVVQTIMDKHWQTVSKKSNLGKISWYAAGLIYGKDYVSSDCDKSIDEIEKLLDILWVAHQEYDAPSEIIDELSTAMRFIKLELNCVNANTNRICFNK